jgi:hypothetical protein
MDSIIGYEVDFLRVGENSKSGDAIAIRYRLRDASRRERYEVMIVDGGDQKAGQALVDHVRYVYKTERVEHVVNTHPDADHCAGLSVVLQDLDVGTLWMHQPWNYAADILARVLDGRHTPNSIEKRLRGKLSAADRLEQIAEENGIPVRSPYRGERIGPFWVLSPDEDWYVDELVPYFKDMPEIDEDEGDQEHLDEGQLWGKNVKSAADWVSEDWYNETLPAVAVEPRMENESSVILWGDFNEDKVLLTGDAGPEALTRALDTLTVSRINPCTNLKLTQLPHHGGRHTVTPTILDRLLGPIRAPTSRSNVCAVACVAKESERPRRVVANAYTRRGARVHTTRDCRGFWYRRDMPERQNVSVQNPLGLFDKVEA